MLLAELDQQLDKRDERRQVLDRLEAGDDAPPVALRMLEQRRAGALDALLRGEIRLQCCHSIARQLTLCLLEGTGRHVDQQRTPAGTARDPGGGDAVAAAEVAPERGVSDQRRGQLVAQLVLGTRRRGGPTRDPFLPIWHAKEA